MKTNTTIITKPARPRCWIVLDLESAVIDETAHRRYQAMERWVPSENQPLRRGYTRSEDPLTCPRWVFQTITTAALMVLTEHDDGNLDIARFVTLSAPDYSERELLEGLLKVLDDAPEGAEIVSWAGMVQDAPLIVAGCMRYGLALPDRWKWLSFGGGDPARHIDLARVVTGGFKMKPVHLAEVLAAMDLPGKITAPPFAVASLISAGRWDEVQCVCEVDVLSTALLLARWRRLHDARAAAHVVEDRILRQVIALRAGRPYVPELEERLRASFQRQLKAAANDAAADGPGEEDSEAA